jgi:DNA-binding NarL/FixJ family response regulator
VLRRGTIEASSTVSIRPSSRGKWGFSVSSLRIPSPIYIGLISDEPIRLAGLGSIFEQPAREGQAQLVPITGTVNELLARTDIEYLVIDLSSSTSDMETLETIRRMRPAVRLIVIGPQGNEDLIHETIIGGARAYLDHTADTEVVRSAIEEVTRGSIWAPRRILSKLIDRLLKVPVSNSTCSNPHLTDREREVLDLILMARSNREIARQLGIEERTVKAHVGRLMRKTGSDNRIELTMHTLNASKTGGGGASDRRQRERRQSERRKDFKRSEILTDQ